MACSARDRAVALLSDLNEWQSGRDTGIAVSRQGLERWCPRVLGLVDCRLNAVVSEDRFKSLAPDPTLRITKPQQRRHIPRCRCSSRPQPTMPQASVAMTGMPWRRPAQSRAISLHAGNTITAALLHVPFVRWRESVPEISAFEGPATGNKVIQFFAPRPAIVRPLAPTGWWKAMLFPRDTVSAAPSVFHASSPLRPANFAYGVRRDQLRAASERGGGAAPRPRSSARGLREIGASVADCGRLLRASSVACSSASGQPRHQPVEAAATDHAVAPQGTAAGSF